MRNLLSFVCLFLLTTTAIPEELQQLHEDVSVDLVNVTLSAMDEKGRFVTDLRRDELILKENGIAQKITNFTNFSESLSDKLGEDGVPLTAAIVIDTSASMGYAISGTQLKIDIVKNAAFRIIDEFRQEDQVMLVAFDETVREVSPMGNDFTQTRHDLLFEDVRWGNTALLDAIYYAMDKMKDKPGRKIIVVCSDGEDTASRLKFDEVLSNLVASDVTVLAFGTMDLGSNTLRGHYTLEKLAEASGGLAFFPTTLGELDSVMNRLRQGMRSQYSVAYKPAMLQGRSWRKIEIICKRPHLKLRYREGYSANSASLR